MNVRSLLALALAAVLVPAAASAAPAPATSSSSMSQDLYLGGFIGYETDDFSGLSLRGDLEIPFRQLSPQVKLSWVGSVGYSYLTWDTLGIDFTAHVLKFIPSARFTFPINPQFSLFADGGLGLYYASLDADDGFGFGLEFDDSDFNLIMRIGGGMFYELNPSTRLGAMLEFNPYFGDFDQTTFIIQGGVMFRI